MRLSYQIRSKVNQSPRFMEHAPADWSTRQDWQNVEGQFSCDNGRYVVMEDPKFGYVIAERRNIAHAVGSGTTRQ